MQALVKRILLNLRVIWLAGRGRWISGSDVARSYTRLSPCYDSNWLVHLQATTDAMLNMIDGSGVESIIDLGCGTGYSTQLLAQRFRGVSLTAVDISSGMLDLARKRRYETPVSWACSDMLSFLRQRPDQSVDCIVSAWAIGYSKPAEIIRQASRILKPGGKIYFVVNYFDTLQPVFDTFRMCMRAFPKKVASLTLPSFPRNRKIVVGYFRKAGMNCSRIDEGHHLIRASYESPMLPWLLSTGILAGFDSVLPLGQDPELDNYFEQTLGSPWKPLHHHYVIAAGEKP